MTTRDPVRLALLRNGLDAIADEMAVTVVRTARSYVIKEAMDFSTGLIARDGQLVAQGLCLPVHMGSFPPTIRAVLDKFGDTIRPGDVFATNDPYTGGGTHLPDIYIFKPVFLKDELIGFAAAIGHQTDIGGRVAGGNACDSTEIYQEGIRIPPIRIAVNDKIDQSFMEILRLNVRLPDKVEGDVMATIAACRRGEKGLLELAHRHGADSFADDINALLDQAEHMTREELKALPDGEWEFEDFLDDDGFTDDPLRFYVKLTKKGSDLTVDFTGTCAQVPSSINLPIAMTESCVYAAVRSVLSSDLPTNSGFMRVINIITEPGSMVHPVPPGAVAARGLTSMRVSEAIWGALSKMLPHKVFACGVQGDFGVIIAGYRDKSDPFVLLEFLFGTWGGRPNKDANDGLASLAVNYSNSPVEIIEGEQPVRIERYGFRDDSGGPGRYRGGLGLIREYCLVGVDEAVLQVRSDRQKFQPYGLQGGHPGAFARNYINFGKDDEERLPGKFMRTLKRGQTYSAFLAGGGGWGNPLDRPPADVLENVLDDKVSLETAREAYGVVIDSDAWVVDEAATERLRQSLRHAGASTREAAAE
ncbi:hydantoinase B/oxoprolinase family protein [Sneathiella sp.]|uniref:hydantoinase B/oxoprolinase family protein n=1 Tax=Sneathiella sp. TaxID=1964365 RepID=UPI002FE28C8E